MFRFRIVFALFPGSVGVFDVHGERGEMLRCVFGPCDRARKED